MRCRAASSAAQSLQHLWISDSVLSEAFRRFARVSLAQAKPRRHGSNVPGPLEAKRRLSRRRMGMTTIERGSGSAPPAEEVGVLFGFGRRSGPPIGVEFAKGWRYQAPHAPAKLAQQRQVAKLESPGLYWPMVGSDGLPWELARDERQVSVDEDNRLNEFLRIPEHVVEGTQASFDAILASLTAKQALRGSDLEPIIKALDNNITESGGHYLIRLIETLGTHSIPQQAWRRLASMVKAKISHRNISSEELLTIFKLILGRTKDWDLVIFLFANRIVATNAKDCLLDALEYIVTSREHGAKTKTWLEYIQSRHDSIRDGDVRSTSWRKLHELLAEHFEPSDQHVVHYFGRMKRSELARVLLEYYVPGWINQIERKGQCRDIGVDSTSEVMANDEATAGISRTHSLPVEAELFNTYKHAMTVNLAQAKIIFVPTSAPHTEAGIAGSVPQSEALPARAYESRLKYLITQSKRNLGPRRRSILDDEDYTQTYAVVDLADNLARYKLPYTRLLDEVAEIYVQTQRNTTTKNFFMELRRRKHCVVPTAVAAKLVHHFVAQNEVQFAYEVFRSVPTLPLLPYAELLLKLVQGGKTHGASIFEMLIRFHPEERIPEHWRIHRRLSLKQEHIDLVHEVAYVFASSEHLSPRTAFRRVWECYRFLRDRRAPLQPLISRAFVKAGISRPVKESERLSEEQVKYIISIVHKVEGAAIAKEVDQLAWEVWTGTLERQWSRKTAPPAKGPGDQGRFYENRRRLWTKGGGHVYSPHESDKAVDDEIHRPCDHVNQDNAATGNTEDIRVDGGSTSSQIMTYEPMTNASSLTELNEVLVARTRPVDELAATGPAFCDKMPEVELVKDNSAAEGEMKLRPL